MPQAAALSSAGSTVSMHKPLQRSVALTRLAQGNVSNLKGVGGGVLEHRVDFGPGYRIYLGRDGRDLVILLGGGTKHRQQQDIESALTRWTDYKTRRKEAR